MSQTIRTLAQVLNELADNTSRLISPENVRDEAVSSWGALYAFDPLPTDDNTNQAGNGFFDEGSRWFNTAAKRLFVCFDGSHSAADWRQVYPPVAPSVEQPPVGSVYWFLDSTLPHSGLPTIGVYTLQDGETGFQETFADPHLTGPWVVHPGAWTRPAWFADGTVFNQPFVLNCIVGLANQEGDYHPCLFRGAPYAVGDPFTPWTVGTDIITWARVGTGGFYVISADANINVTPAVPQPTNIPGSFVLTANPSPVLQSPQLTPLAANPGTPNTFWVDSTTFNLWFNNNAVVPQAVIIAGAGTVFSITKHVDWTSVVGFTHNLGTVVVHTMGARAMLLSVASNTTQQWLDTGGGGGHVSLFVRSDDGTGLHGDNQAGGTNMGSPSNTIINAALPLASPVPVILNGNLAGDDFRTWDILLEIDDVVQNLNTLVQGHTEIYLVIAIMPN